MKKPVSVVENGGLTFVCEDSIEVTRAETLFTKEPGTIRWLQEQVRPGDVVYDIGANIGTYTLLAAERVRSSGFVYAFEPHLVNAAQLLRNVAANGYRLTVSVLLVALGDRPSYWGRFHYRSLRHGSSGSALGDDVRFMPDLTETVFSTTVDDLIAQEVVVRADVIKIDVDGNELQVLQGMSALLASGHPRSVQVEMAPRNSDAIQACMEAHGYVLTGRHCSSYGQAAIDTGAQPETITDNAVFLRARAT